jgi:hypothetical protein
VGPSTGILLCEIISRVEADPDIMPRTNNFGIDEAQFRCVVVMTIHGG